MRILSLFWHSIESDTISTEYLDGSNPAQSVFREQIEFIVDKFTPISISDFINILEDNGLLKPYVKPPVLLGFDDGFKNVINYALPILEEFRVPALFFVIGEILINPDYVPWYVEIEHILRKTKKKTTKYNTVKFDIISKQDRILLRNHLITSFKKCKTEKNRQGFMIDLSQLLDIERPKALMLDEDLRFVSKEDLINIGDSSLLTVASHAMTHNLLANLSQKEQIYELEKSHLLLREHCPSYYPVISYPNNSFNEITVDIAKGIFKCAFACSKDSSYGNIYTYPRIGINGVDKLTYLISPFRIKVLLPLKHILHNVGIRKID